MMKAVIEKFGNDLCIKLPKNLIKKFNIKDEVELKIYNNEVVVKAVKEEKMRKDWEREFKKMAEMGDDRLIEFPDTDWELENWEWK